jgi:hypothetical protein
MKNFKFLLKFDIGGLHQQLSPYFNFYRLLRKSRLIKGHLDFPSIPQGLKSRIPQTVSHIFIKSDTGDFQE